MFAGLAIYGKPTTTRVKNRFSDLNEARPFLDSQRAVYFTEYMREHWDEPVHLRTAGAFRHVLAHLSPKIWDDELLVGSATRYLRGAHVYPEKRSTPPAPAGKETAAHGHDPSSQACSVLTEDSRLIDQATAFWRDKDLLGQCEQSFVRMFRRFGPPDSWRYPFNSWYFSPRACNGLLLIDYRNILGKGLDSIIDHIRACISSNEPLSFGNEAENLMFYKGIIRFLQGIITFAENYADEAERLAGQRQEQNRTQELLEIARICRKVPRHAPDTFREALQAFWFVHLSLCIESQGRGVSPGRFDQYMNPYFEHDLQNGTLSVPEALELLELLRIKCEELIFAQPVSRGDFISRSLDQHITLAGSDRAGNPADTQLSKFMIQARMHIHTRQPILGVRWRDDLGDFFKRKVIDGIQNAGWCPDIYHDKAGTKSFTEQAKDRIRDCHNWIAYRDCTMDRDGFPGKLGELIKAHHTRILDLLIHDGLFSPGEKALLEEDIRRKCFARLVQSFSGMIERELHRTHPALNDTFLTYNHAGLVHPFMMVLNNIGGEGSTEDNTPLSYSSQDLIVAYGMIDLAKALAVIKKYVLDEAIFTLSEIRDAIQTDFEGTETMRQKLLRNSSSNEIHPFFEEFLLELLDAWSSSADNTVTGLKRPPSSRRLTLIKSITRGQENPAHV